MQSDYHSVVESISRAFCHYFPLVTLSTGGHAQFVGTNEYFYNRHKAEVLRMFNLC